MMNPLSSQAPACCLAVVLAAGAAWAQQADDGGPVVVGEKNLSYKALELVRLDTHLDLLAQWRQDQVRGTGLPTLTETETLLRPTIDMNGEVYIGHKNLIDLMGTVKLGLEQDTLDSPATGTNNTSLSFTNEYDLNALVLGEGPVPTTVYSRRSENILHQDFGGSLTNTVNETGAIAQIRSAVAPTMLQLYHRDQDQTNQLGGGNYKVSQNSALMHSDVHLTSSQRLLVDSSFDHVDQTGTAAVADSYDHTQVNLTHLLNFGPLNQDSLRSMGRLDDQTGAFGQKTIQLDEELLLQLNKHLESRTYLTLEDLNRQGQEQRIARGNTLLRHHLFDSLTSTGTVGGGTVDVPGVFASNDVFVTGALDYTKRVPYGNIDAAVSLSVNRQNNGERGSTVAVPSGTFTFNDPFPVVISRQNIIESSIVVMDTARLRVYLNGADYTVEVFPDRAELRRVVGGPIANGQTVVIDFEVGPAPANQITSTSELFSLRYNVTDGLLSGLSVYASYRTLSQDVEAVDPSVFVLESFNDLTYGAEYHVGGATFLAEQDLHDSTVSPFDSTRFEARYDRRFSRASVMRLSLARNYIDYTDTHQTVELYLATGRLTQKLLSERGEDLDLSFHVEGRQENHSDSPDLHGFETGLDISWHKRQTTIYASVFASVLDTGQSVTTSESISIGLKRAF